MLSLLVAKQALKDDFFIRGDTPISSRMFFVQGACCLFIFLVFKLRVKRILVHFYFQLFRVDVPPAYAGGNPEIFHNTLQTLMGECSCERTVFQSLVG